MNDRNCEECKHKTKNGCESWDCHFEAKGLTEEEVEHYSKLAEHFDRNEGRKMTRKEAAEIINDIIYEGWLVSDFDIDACKMAIVALEEELKIGRCKDCRHYLDHSVVCKKWGGGCKTKENGYCFLFELQESEVEE